MVENKVKRRDIVLTYKRLYKVHNSVSIKKCYWNIARFILYALSMLLYCNDKLGSF